MQVHNYKYVHLGVVLSDTLSCDKHIHLIHKKAARGIGLLRRLSWFLPKHALCSLYNTYVLPHLSYADAVWSISTKVQSSSLKCLQNYAARIILCRYRDASASAMRQELGWPTRRAASEAMVMHLSVSGHGPSYLINLFRSVASTHLYMR